MADTTGSGDAVKHGRSEDLQDKGLEHGSVGALASVVLGVVLMFVWQRMVPEFLEGETFKRDTPVLVVEED
jgi:hypothetical protein